MTASLVLGPLLRHVGTTTASVWVETDARATVEVLGHRAKTFEVRGQHYALVAVDDLEPGSCRTYEVHVDGERVWPIEPARTPPSRIRTRSTTDTAGRMRAVFGSCRYPPTDDPELEASLGIDALDAYATRLMEHVQDLGEQQSAEASAALPDALFLLGDQVYADETTPRTQRWIAEHRDPEEGSGTEIANYREYAHLYHESWTDRELRWLLSTVPTAMIFDDHDIRDDWNTSQAWRDEMAQTPWWRQRIQAGLASYWVYQHIGNLDPDALKADELYGAVTAATGDVYDLLSAHADKADAEIGEPTGLRWSYRWDIGRTRLLMVDTRCGRVLNDHERLMINTPSFSWLEENAFTHAQDDVDHLLIGSSIPWLMPPAIAHAQSMNEYSANRPGRFAIAERLRQEVDLEHWPAFRASFDRMARMIERAAAASGAPATICVLSGDVHHSYAAQASFPTPTNSRVYQLTCSPVRNNVPWFMEYVFSAGWRPRVSRLIGRLSSWWGVPPPAMSWGPVGGPYFGNAVATLDITGRDARMRIERSEPRGGLECLADLPLT